MKPAMASMLIRGNTVVALLAREVVEDRAIDDVGKHAGCIAEQATDAEGRAGDVLVNADFNHGCPEHAAHREHNPVWLSPMNSWANIGMAGLDG